MSNSTKTLSYASQSQVKGTVGTDIVTVLPSINVRGTILFVNKEVNMTLTPPVVGIVGMGYYSTPNFLDLAYKAK